MLQLNLRINFVRTVEVPIQTMNGKQIFLFVLLVILMAAIVKSGCCDACVKDCYCDCRRGLTTGPYNTIFDPATGFVLATVLHLIPHTQKFDIQNP
jgi:hypothetical protein